MSFVPYRENIESEGELFIYLSIDCLIANQSVMWMAHLHKNMVIFVKGARTPQLSCGCMFFVFGFFFLIKDLVSTYLFISSADYKLTIVFIIGGKCELLILTCVLALPFADSFFFLLSVKVHTCFCVLQSP